MFKAQPGHSSGPIRSSPRIVIPLGNAVVYLNEVQARIEQSVTVTARERSHAGGTILLPPESETATMKDVFSTPSQACKSSMQSE
jgi:hypothetical protein